MKKLILSVFILSVLLVSSLPAWAAEEQWTNGTSTSTYNVQRDGNSITLIPIKPKRLRAEGIPILVGSITGTTFTGKVYLFADECPSLDGYVPASGTVSENGTSISITNTMTNYSPTNCEINYTHEGSVTYTRVSVANTSPAPSLSVAVPTSNDCLKEYHNIQNECSDGHIACADDCPDANGIDLGPLGVCLRTCDLQETECDNAAKATYDACVAVQEDDSFTCERAANGTCIPGTARFEDKDTNLQPTGSMSPEKPQVGVSSRDFRALARANAEYQKAQADLEKLKADNDSRYDAKKDFPDEYNSKLDEVASQIVQEQKQDKEEVKDNLKILRTDLERLRDALSSYSDIKDVRDALKAGKSGSYGGVSLASDLIGGATDFVDLIGEDVSVDNAATKVGIDTVVPNALYTIPILKAADTVLNVPDKIANAFGVGEDNWYRKNSTGFLKEHSISGFVKLTTKAMIKTGSWTNVNGAFQVAWSDVKEAEGIGEKVLSTLDLVGTAVGAVPVAAAIGIRDTVFVGGKVAIDYVSSWFTWPN